MHTRTDILRVLSAANDVDEAPKELALTPKDVPPVKPPRRRLFRFRSQSSHRTATLGSTSAANGGGPNGVNSSGQEAGMEKDLLNKIEKMNFRSQMQAFYAAYSKVCLEPYNVPYLSDLWLQYLVLSPSFVIDFFSPDVVDMLLIDPAVDTTFVGSDVFRVLGNYAPGLPKTFRERVRGSVQAGRAISADLQLSTRRSMMMRGNERFVSHWTPLKDEHQRLKYVVVCFAPLEG